MSHNEIQTLLHEGNLHQAKLKAKALCKDNANNADSWLLLAAVYASESNITEVIFCCKQALRLQPDNVQVNYNLAVALVNQGKHKEALKYYHKVIEASPDAVNVHYQLGVLYNKLSDINNAILSYQSVLKCDAQHIGALINLGSLLFTIGKLTEAENCYLKVLDIDSKSIEAHFNLGNTYYRMGDARAIDNFRNVINLNPENSVAYNSLGAALVEAREFNEALSEYQKALSLNPNYPDALTNLGNVYTEVGLLDESIECHLKAIGIDPNNVAAHYNLATTLSASGELNEAEKYFNILLALESDNIGAIVGKIQILEKKGEVSKAYKLAKPLIDNNVKDTELLIVYATLSKSLGHEEEAIHFLENHIDSEFLSKKEQISAHFALGERYDHLGKFDAAFSHYSQANKLSSQSVNKEKHAEYIDNIISVFKEDDISMVAVANPCDPRPVFIVGMPRSGTSLVEQILSSNSNVYGVGELLEIPNIIKSLYKDSPSKKEYPFGIKNLELGKLNSLVEMYMGAIEMPSASVECFTDKLPYNYLYLGLVGMLFPNAKVIHCRRDPLDTCLSCYFNNFIGSQDYFHDLDALGFYYKQYEKLMAHWKVVLNIPILDVTYEELVKNPELESKKIIEYCGIEWEESCLAFYNSSRITHTASYNQVRQPLYKTSINRWKNYEKYIEPLKNAM